MKTEIINSITLLANIFTILGFIIAFITFLYFLKDYLSKLEYEIRKNFIDKENWTNEGDTSYQNSINFELNISNSDSYIFSGKINLSNHPEQLTFYFQKSFGKSFTIRIHKNIGYRDFDLAIAKLKIINPDLIQITFIKSFEEDNNQPNLPYKTFIWPFKP
ncbi:hypothetical protein NDN11_12710 [Acinetobacter sp. C26M]|uniref:hypothetical protein n=1 Tax=unclassified Acinetobacter TaxID=196816 RepID=UPI002036A67E|nr:MULTISPECIES: hypothetical protein [unclassified Acinetobacter]USA45571.1 hypothetical protein NDN11_12710 [Acinetobacter sp. C26M]USA49071.1 hypothetical protein NDN12_12705 [Acinetobacter sp. C26G]